MIDSHAHLADRAFEADLDEVLDRARAAGVEEIVVPGTDVESSRRAAGLVAGGDGRRGVRLHAAVGVHPHEAARYDDETERTVESLARAPGVVAIGEIGLDFHYDDPPRDVQAEAFRRQLALARRLDLPVVIHCREAERETLDALTAEPPPGGVLHCWTGSLEGARRGVEMGLAVSFAGILAFPRSDALRLVAAGLPPASVLVETDAPYLAPPPHRGRRCEPAHVVEVVKALARARGAAPETIAFASAAAARTGFRIARAGEIRQLT